MKKDNEFTKVFKCRVDYEIYGINKHGNPAKKPKTIWYINTTCNEPPDNTQLKSRISGMSVSTLNPKNKTKLNMNNHLIKITKITIGDEINPQKQ